MSEERGFEVVDKRGTRAEPVAESAAEAATDSAAEGDVDSDDAADIADEMGQFNPFAGITVNGVIEMTIGLLSERAWISMGLVADPGTGSVNKDIEEARRAIDVVGDLARHLEPVCTPEQKRELQTMLTNLRLNFVKQQDQG